jgi:predicted TIM-barrel fold metal-dependent hydrolase
MPIIDMQCHFGVAPETRAVPRAELSEALAYADQYAVETLCFTSHEATNDIGGGNARLDQALQGQPRFRGWLSLSVHQPALSIDLANYYLRLERWVGARFDQEGEDDALTHAGGREILNGLRRFSKPVLVTVTSPDTLQSVLAAADELSTLRFLICPQSEELTADAIAAMREHLNTALVPVAAFTERDMLAQAVRSLGERGERRVLWASDWGRFHPATALGAIKDAALPGPQRERILYRNAREFLM